MVIQFKDFSWQKTKDSDNDHRCPEFDFAIDVLYAHVQSPDV